MCQQLDSRVGEKAELWTQTHTIITPRLRGILLAAHAITAVLKCSPLIIVALLMYKHTRGFTRTFLGPPSGTGA